ncbi:hypothetical protein RJT34_16428 [Clitoria ternatea]|uniref:Uncharacterized protein n=1 Tax=Clitoria ternatea TaxID=43366 RepID=A0AAN9J761_CLITE
MDTASTQKRFSIGLRSPWRLLQEKGGQKHKLSEEGPKSCGKVGNMDDKSLTPSEEKVEAMLDKENFTLEELLDEEEVIQEYKALNSCLINLFPFIASEIFTCEIYVILKTLVDEE